MVHLTNVINDTTVILAIVNSGVYVGPLIKKLVFGQYMLTVGNPSPCVC